MLEIKDLSTESKLYFSDVFEHEILSKLKSVKFNFKYFSF